MCAVVASLQLAQEESLSNDFDGLLLQCYLDPPLPSLVCLRCANTVKALRLLFFFQVPTGARRPSLAPVGTCWHSKSFASKLCALLQKSSSMDLLRKKSFLWLCFACALLRWKQGSRAIDSEATLFAYKQSALPLLMLLGIAAAWSVLTFFWTGKTITAIKFFRSTT